MTEWSGLIHSLTLRANSARRRGEVLVLELPEAVALHEGLFGPVTAERPYHPPTMFLGVEVRVIDPDGPRIELDIDPSFLEPGAPWPPPRPSLWTRLRARVLAQR